MLEVVVYGIALAWVVRVMLLESKSSHFGPWPSRTAVVYFPEEEHAQPVAFFDRIRRLFGVYTIKDGVWEVRKLRAEVWECPICLSLWLAIPFTALLFLSEPFWRGPQIAIAHLAMTSLSAMLCLRVYKT